MNCRSRCTCALIVLICTLAVPGILSAETIYVDPDGKDGYATIQAAVDAAGQGDTIVVNPGTYTGRGNRDIEIRGKSITIQSSDDANAETTIIDCGGTANDPSPCICHL